MRLVPNVVICCPNHVISFTSWNVTERCARAPSSAPYENRLFDNIDGTL